MLQVTVVQMSDVAYGALVVTIFRRNSCYASTDMLFAFFEKHKLILKTTAVKNKRDRNTVRVILKFFAFSLINFCVLYLITICFTFLFL